MEIIIAGEWNSPNLGDEVICKTFTHLIYQRLPPGSLIHTLDISAVRLNYIQYKTYKILKKIKFNLGENYYKYRRKKTVEKDIKKLLKYNNINKVIIPGGALIQQYFSKSLEVVIKNCSYYNVPVFFNACGYGFNDEKSSSIFRWIFMQKCVKEITTRDDLSCLIKDNIKIVPDIAIVSNLYYNLVKIKNDNNLIGINILDYYYYKKCSNDKISSEDYNNKVISMIKLLSMNYTIRLFTNGDHSDDRYLKWVYSQVKDLEVTIELRPVNGFELTKIISQFSFIIGFRLHSLIIAYSFDIPTIGIAWDNKLFDFGKMIDNDNIYYLSDINLNNLNSLIKNKLNKKFNFDRKIELKSQIFEQINSYIKNDF
ncbi:polysaccharide pyruvyl transferase family protein [uncultured Apibacter sp.]|uniref:polysaccharide pyruvyl transferase family protein n=1 Tax=uncultured Apibacter sp. TaxID=1778616 RepID=UPI0025DA0681|nr:polysaccharide pyruvyl transferase family protein [uncultured Apibacter sp.]